MSHRHRRLMYTSALIAQAVNQHLFNTCCPEFYTKAYLVALHCSTLNWAQKPIANEASSEAYPITSD